MGNDNFLHSRHVLDLFYSKFRDIYIFNLNKHVCPGFNWGEGYIGMQGKVCRNGNVYKLTAQCTIQSRGKYYAFHFDNFPVYKVAVEQCRVRKIPRENFWWLKLKTIT